MKILNPAYVRPVSSKETKIRGVISAMVAALPTSDRGINFQEIRAEILALYPALNFDRGDVQQAAIDLGYAVENPIE